MYVCVCRPVCVLCVCVCGPGSREFACVWSRFMRVCVPGSWCVEQVQECVCVYRGRGGVRVCVRVYQVQVSLCASTSVCPCVPGAGSRPPAPHPISPIHLVSVPEGNLDRAPRHGELGQRAGEAGSAPAVRLLRGSRRPPAPVRKRRLSRTAPRRSGGSRNEAADGVRPLPPPRPPPRKHSPGAGPPGSRLRPRCLEPNPVFRGASPPAARPAGPLRGL